RTVAALVYGQAGRRPRIPLQQSGNRVSRRNRQGRCLLSIPGFVRVARAGQPRSARDGQRFPGVLEGSPGETLDRTLGLFKRDQRATRTALEDAGNGIDKSDGPGGAKTLERVRAGSGRVRRKRSAPSPRRCSLLSQARPGINKCKRRSVGSPQADVRHPYEGREE